jgi:hypothetical protein
MSKTRVVGLLAVVFLALSVLTWAQQPVDVVGSVATSTSQIEAATEATQAAMDTLLTRIAQDATHDNAVVASGPQGVLEAKDFDNLGFPNVVSAEGDAVRAAGSLYGVGYVMLVNEDGSAVGSVGQSGTWTVQPGNTANTTPWLVTTNAATSGGCTPGSSISTAAVLETEIKATAGQLYQMMVTSIDATPVYAKLYNDTAANTDETDTPIQRFVVPSQGTANGAGFALPIPTGMVFSTAITLRVTTGAADNDTGALTANEVLVSYCYK